MEYYCEVYETLTGFGWRLYRYDSEANEEAVVHQDEGYESQGMAATAAVGWCEENNIEARMV